MQKIWPALLLICNVWPIVKPLILFTCICNFSKIKIKNLEVFKKAGVNIPLGDLCLKLDGSYKFQKPSKVSIIGSFLLKNLIKPLVCIDVGVEMPSSYFNERDFMNYRYFIKRSFYMAHVYMKLSKEAKFNEFKFDYCAEHGSLFKPYLTLKPNRKQASIVLNCLFIILWWKLIRFKIQMNHLNYACVSYPKRIHSNRIGSIQLAAIYEKICFLMIRC